MHRFSVAFLCCLTMAGCGTSMQGAASGDNTPTQLVEAGQDERASAAETARINAWFEERYEEQLAFRDLDVEIGHLQSEEVVLSERYPLDLGDWLIVHGRLGILSLTTASGQSERG
jgi:hypothetical protein